MSTTALGGCGQGGPAPAAIAARPDGGPPPAQADAPPEFIDRQFDELYPIFLTRKILPGPKAAAWREYYSRWVRWTGTVVSFTANGITLKQFPQTVTFDVSLWIEGPQRKELRRLMHAGDRVSYIGRLDSYDDVFRTLYLTHGQVMANLGKPDAGH